ncbi:mevalonate kinase [Marine Group I thaumarchaeote]|uniref:mevalonate kinase n=1 Tax=Marine Group I thaumarchaeote TaxID=2511932 RepID=A0A7K4MY62_9ARCH|nr:mevalonate kinase [Marine Group I thaumarchaeote]PBO82274.1 MAG: mevalonate kinase [Nitrosopumilales archaeon]RTZ70063.1 MAG: mevalonate kinase [Nitrososphaerota archaeon]NWJ44106.1 mevalonate kinase [Marine Group I thaumarchaeote]NWJ68174.1 mevalonate kinase [Marine Group I thaumarchaeote]
MKSIASAPGKIILFGEHFVVHGTKAILAAIDKRVTVTSTFTENKTIKVNSQLGTLEVPISSSYEEVKSEFRPFVYLANKIINSNQNVNGLEVTIDSDIPIGVGLGSSSACCVAAAASISELFKELSSEEILNISIEAEKTIFPDTSGADCTVCTYGGMIEYEQFTGTKKIDNTFELNLVIANSMIPHTTKNSVERVSKFKENDEERFSQLCDLETKLIDEVIVAMKNNDVTTLGLKMSENQKYLEEIQVSNDTLRDMISSLNEISLGSKITGAGDGGCIIALIKDENMDQIPALLGNDKECFSAKIDTKGVVWSKIEQ